MFKQSPNGPRPSALGVLTALLVSAPTWATEELTVYGGETVARVRAAEARFVSDMDAYRQSVDVQLRDARAAELKESVNTRLVLASIESSTRG